VTVIQFVLFCNLLVPANVHVYIINSNNRKESNNQTTQQQNQTTQKCTNYIKYFTKFSDTYSMLQKVNMEMLNCVS